MWFQIHWKRDFKETHKICSWRKQAIQVQPLWTWSCTKRTFKEAHRNCSWKNQAIQVQHMWIWNCSQIRFKETQQKAAQQSTLKKHIESVHERIKPFKCKLCDYEAARPSQLKRNFYFNEFVANVLRDNMGIIFFDLWGCGGC